MKKLLKLKLLPLTTLLLVFSMAALAADTDGALYVFQNDDLAYYQSVSEAGDVNNDGYGDVIVGSAQGDSGTSGDAVHVFSGVDGGILHAFDGDNWFGYAVSGAGDVNNDGYDDVIVGAHYDDNNGTDSGSVRVFSGIDGATLYTFNGDSADDWFGYSVSGTGDVNGDSYADFVVGAYRDDNNGSNSGSARVFSGVNGSILYTFNGDSAADKLGSSVSGAGDVNNDGYDDVIVGAVGDDNAGSASGSARIFSGMNGSILYTLNGDSASDEFGTSVSGTGDVNNDGYDDVIVGAVGDDNAGSTSGSARIFSGMNGSILYTFNGDSENDAFGTSVSGAGDVNGDGYADVIVGAHIDKSASVFSGVNGELLRKFSSVAVSHYTSSVSGAGDVNGDGYSDLIVIDNDITSGGSAIVFSGYLPPDNDGDGISDLLDPDDDNDGVDDALDAFPADGCATVDTDSDGMPDTLNPAGSCLIDGFETGNFSANPWVMNVPSHPWTIEPEGHSGSYSAHQPVYLGSNALQLTHTFPTTTTLVFYYRNKNYPGYVEVPGPNINLPITSGSSWKMIAVAIPAGTHILQWVSSGSGLFVMSDIWLDDLGTTLLVEDVDDDNDSIEDASDPFPLDTDNDGINNSADTDDDNDSVLDGDDNCLLIANTDQLNTDGDAQGNGCDTDDDSDDMPDTWEQSYGLNPLVDDAAGDLDSDGISNLDEYTNGTDPTVSDLAATPYDFDADGDSDMLLRKPSTGENIIWLLENGAKVGTSILTTNATTFEVAAILDGDNDGDADILWYDSAQGKLIFWQMENGLKQANAFLGNTTATLDGVGDFDGDGDPDILLKTSAGAVKVWTLNNLALALSTNIGTPASGYTVIDTGDFNGDGIDDIVMQNASGAVRIWQLNSSAQLAATINVATINTSYSLKKSGDTDNDGDDDLIFRNDSTGQSIVWEMENGSRVQANTLSGLNPAMSLATVTDFDKDGDEDLLFRDITAGNASDGDTILWKMQDNIKQSNSFLGNNAVSFLLESTLDMDGDSDFDILYRDSTTGQILGWNMENGAKVGNYPVGNPGISWETRF